MPKILLVMTPFWDYEVPPLTLAQLVGICKYNGFDDIEILDLNVINKNKNFALLENAPGGIHPPLFYLGFYANNWIANKNDDLLFSKTVDEYSNMILERHPDIVMFSVNLATWQFTIPIATTIKRGNTKIKIVLGGVHSNFLLEYAQKLRYNDCLDTLFNSCDIIIKNEAEISLPLVLNSIDNKARLREIEGISYKSREEIFDINNSVLISNLDEVPLPDYSHFDIDGYHTGKIKFMPIHFSRGCKNTCGFCCESGYWQKLRMKSPMRCIEEMKNIYEIYSPTHFLFTDCALHPSFNETEELLQLKIDEEINAKWHGNSTFDNLDSVLDLYSKSACAHITIGIESGNDYLRKRMGKSIRTDEMLVTLKKAKDYDFTIRTNLMFGYPGENEDTIKETMELARILQDLVKYIHVFQYMPSPFSRLPTRSDMSKMLSDVEDEQNVPIGPYLYYKPKVYISEDLLFSTIHTFQDMEIPVEYFIPKKEYQFQ